MKYMSKLMIISVLVTGSLTSCGYFDRSIRTAEDVTPGNPKGEKLDWRYGATDIKIQTTKVTRQLMNRWFAKTSWDLRNGKPRIVITQVDNRTDQYISLDMIRDIFEGAAVSDGRFTVVVGDTKDERELDAFMADIVGDPKYSNSTRLNPNSATAPQFLAKVRLTEAVTADAWSDYEDYRMSVTLYDIQTQEVVDTAWDVLTKKVER